MKKNKIVYICPYFGKFPDHFKLWLKSCEFNDDCKWVIYTDDKRQFDYPKNVIVNYCTLSDLQKKFSKKLCFNVALKTIKKLGDYKPLYGYLFNDDIGDAQAWGHVDVNDSIYGKITNFLTDDVLSEYDKIMTCGHMSVYKNTIENNKRFMIPLKSGVDYKTIFMDDTFYNFEELAPISITTIYKENGIKIKDMSENYADITIKYYNLRMGRINRNFDGYYVSKTSSMVFAWDNGKLYGFFRNKNKVTKKEFMYIHIKRRKLNININLDEDKYIITQDGFMPYENITANYIKKHDKNKLIYKTYLDIRIKSLKSKLRGKIICNTII